MVNESLDKRDFASNYDILGIAMRNILLEEYITSIHYHIVNDTSLQKPLALLLIKALPHFSVLCREVQNLNDGLLWVFKLEAAIVSHEALASDIRLLLLG